MDLQHLLESSRHFWQTQWNIVLDWFGNDEFNMVVWGTFIVTTAIYWITGLSFLLIDLTGKPKFVLKYRIQANSSYPVTFEKVLKITKQLIFNQFVCGIPLAFLYFQAMTWRGYDSRRNVPALTRIVTELIFLVILQEIVYYYLHRFLHTPLMFQHIHNVHHKFKSPIAITAAYCHPVEHVCANLLPMLLGPFLLGSHLATAWLWFCIGTVSTMFLHSGFQILKFPDVESHDLHHSKHHLNYGIIGLMDRLHGTNELLKSEKIH